MNRVFFLVGVARIERATVCLKGNCSTTELHTLASQLVNLRIHSNGCYGLHAAPFYKNCSRPSSKQIYICAQGCDSVFVVLTPVL